MSILDPGGGGNVTGGDIIVPGSGNRGAVTVSETAVNSLIVTARQLITDALIEVGVCGETQAPAAKDAARGLRILNRDIMDPWSAQRQFATTRIFTTGTFAALGGSRLVGPNGEGGFVIDPRPVRLLSASYVYTDTSPNIYRGINVNDSDWFADLSMPEFSSLIITDLYYAPDTPDGRLYCYPRPTAIATVQIETLSMMDRFSSLDTGADFAPGYESAISATLRELFYLAWRRGEPPDSLKRYAQRARAIISVNNSQRRSLSTDAPFAGGCSGSDSTAFRTRQF